MTKGSLHAARLSAWLIRGQDARKSCRDDQGTGRRSASVWSSGLLFSAYADPFLDDFEGENESSRYPVRYLRNWTIIDSVDLKTERLVPPICHSTGTCIDLVGTTGLATGGI